MFYIQLIFQNLNGLLMLIEYEVQHIDTGYDNFINLFILINKLNQVCPISKIKMKHKTHETSWITKISYTTLLH